MSDYIVIDGVKVRVDKCEARVGKAEYKEKFKYILRHGKQKAEVVNKGIDELYIEIRQNENRANRTSSESNVSPVTVNVGGKEAVAGSM
jgi:hypothetical protein